MTDITDVLDTIQCADALTFLASLPSASVDMVLCDLPYQMTSLSWDEIIPFAPMWEQFRRVTKLRAAIVLTASQPFTSKLIMSNPHMFKYEWIWVKTKASDHINAKNKPMRRHENVLVFSNGTTANKSLNRMPYNPQGTVAISEWTYRPNRDVGLSHILGTRPSHKKGWIQELTNYPSSVLNFANPNNDLLHPTQKPVALFEYLIRTYTQAGGVVLDPFMGSGTTALVARQLDRHYIGCDLNPDYVALAEKRLRNTDPYQHRELPSGNTQLSLWGAP